VGALVTGIAPGDRVYINPGRSCGSCHACRAGDSINCPAYTFQGYFGFGPASSDIYRLYPYGGFSQYATAPANGLVKLPDSVSFEAAARFGYLGTAYSGLRKAGVGPGRTVLVNGASGTLGLGAVLLARAMGAVRILGVARNRGMLERVRSIDPARIHVLSADEEPVGDWARRLTGGVGVDAVLDTLGPGAPAEAMQNAIGALRRGGRLVDVGGMNAPMQLNMHALMCSQISLLGSLWFTVAEGEEMAAMAEAGTLDLSVFEHRRFALDQVNEALALAERRAGGLCQCAGDPGSANRSRWLKRQGLVPGIAQQQRIARPEYVSIGADKDGLRPVTVQPAFEICAVGCQSLVVQRNRLEGAGGVNRATPADQPRAGAEQIVQPTQRRHRLRKIFSRGG
jgi:alcohol dehydrogenase